MQLINKIGIIGVGLLGGSIGLALKKRFPHIHVAGIGRTEENLVKAINCRAIDSYHLNFQSGVKGCDLVVIATPISTIVSIFYSILPYLKSDAVVTDVGSTKHSIIKEIEQDTAAKNHFVGSHPMAGSEESGVEASNEDIIQNATVVIIENEQTNPAALNKIETFWQSIGAIIKKMTSEKHDEIVAYTSHLPHLMASCLSYTLSNSFSEAEKKARIFGNGLLDTTRIAEGDPKIWLDIFISNQKNILSSIKQFKISLNDIEQFIQNKDIKQIKNYLSKGKIFREEMTHC